MIVLSLYPSYWLSAHDSGAAIAKDGELIYAYEEQKLSRINHRESKYLPDRALLSALFTTQIDPREIDLICLSGIPQVEDPHHIFDRIERYFGISCKNIVACPHHAAHTALSVQGSGFDSGIYWTLDADGGDGSSGEFGTFYGHKTTQMEKFEGQSLPRFYWLLTGACGFTDFEEGKVMGLASYGKVDTDLYDSMSNLFEFGPSGLAMFTAKTVFKPPEIRWKSFSHDEFRPFKVIHYLDRELCPALAEMTREYLPEVVAATGQRLVEDLAIESLKRLMATNGLNIGPLALSGGFFQNVIANKAIKNAFGCEVFVPPATSDMGLAAGAALWSSSKFGTDADRPKSKSQKRFSPFLGPGFSESEVQGLVDSFPVEYTKMSKDDVAIFAARQIAQGKVVGWFQGRAEFGARALGARSVLADPRDPGSKARVNQLLKKRDWFMPYAPSILVEHAANYLENYSDSPYMTLAFDSKIEIRGTVPASIHVDGTVRPHVVPADDNPLYYKLISEFLRITNIPMVLNTSFNRHGVPIVATPRQAIEHLLEGVVDVLCIGGFVINLKGTEVKDEGQTIPETIHQALLGVSKGYKFLEEDDYRTANALFQKTGYQVEYSLDNDNWDIQLNGHTFQVNSSSWDEIASSLAKKKVFPERPNFAEGKGD